MEENKVIERLERALKNLDAVCSMSPLKREEHQLLILDLQWINETIRNIVVTENKEEGKPEVSSK